MKRWLTHLAARLKLSGSFIGPVVTLIGGVVAAQAVVFASRPFLTRMFTPDEFGVLTIFVTLVAVLATLVTGRYEDAGLLPKSDKDAAGLFILALGLSAVSAVVVALFFPWRTGLASVFNTPELATSIILLPAGILTATWGKALEGWHARNNRFGLVSAGRIVQSCVVVCVQLVAGLLGASAFGLTGGVVVGFSALALVVGIPFLARDNVVLKASLATDSLRALANRYRRFPFFSTPAAFLNLVASRIAVFLLAWFYGPGTVGLFGLAFGTLALPVGSVTDAIGQVFGVRAPAAHLKSSLGPLTELVFARLIAVSVFPMAVVAVAGPDLFALVFGEPWREAGVYARILSPWLCAMTIAVPLTRLFDVTEKQRSDLAFSLFLLTAQIVAILIVGGSGKPRTAIAAVSIAGLLSRWSQIAWMLRLGEASLLGGLRVFAIHIALTTFLLLPVGLMVYRGVPIFWMIFGLIVATGIYAVAVIRMDWRSTEGKPLTTTESTGM